MKRITLTLVAALFAIALPLAAFAQHGTHPNSKPKAASSAEDKDHIFISYEEARQALIKESLPDLRRAAKLISVSGHAAEQHKLSELAAALEKAADLGAARLAFAAVSDEVIRYRETRCCNRPVIVYCSMEKKSWVQPEGEIGNPYLDASMRKCGEIRQQ